MTDQHQSVALKPGREFKKCIKRMRKIAKEVAADADLAGLHKASACEALLECRKLAAADGMSPEMGQYLHEIWDRLTALEAKPKPHSPADLDPERVAKLVDANYRLNGATSLLSLWMKFAVNALNSDEMERLPRHTRAFLEDKMTQYKIQVRYLTTVSCHQTANSLEQAIAKVRLNFPMPDVEIVMAVDKDGAELTDEAKRIWEKA